MAEINKLIFEKNDKDHFKITEDALEISFQEMKRDKNRRMLEDMQKTIRNMPPSVQSVLSGMSERMKELMKSQEDTANESIRLSRKLNKLTWIIIGLTVLIVVLTLISVFKVIP